MTWLADPAGPVAGVVWKGAAHSLETVLRVNLIAVDAVDLSSIQNT
jgi:hypothetical protein